MQIGQITPAKKAGPVSARSVSPAEKAAIIVRFLMTEGAELSLTDLPEHLQTELAQQMGSLHRIDRATLVSVVEEFTNELAATGLTFPSGVAGALSALDGQISPQAAARLRKQAGVKALGDPWEQLRALESEALLTIIEQESTEVAAVLISKIDVKKAAEILGKLPGKQARHITYAMSKTTTVTPDAVDRIGRALVDQLADKPEVAFDNPPEDRVGAILNSSRSATRDDVLSGLDEADEAFASEVRKAIFTFKHVATRVDLRDVPAILRVVDNDVLVTALAAALDPETAASRDHILNNISSRMADQLREAIEDRGAVSEEDGEIAMADVVSGIRTLASNGEIILLESIQAE